jgi:hypothetical protein
LNSSQLFSPVECLSTRCMHLVHDSVGIEVIS